MARVRNAAHTIAAVRRLLSQITAKHPDVGILTGKVEELIVSLVPEAAEEGRERGRKGEGVHYTVEMTGQREVVYEHRPAGAPLRASHEAFGTVVAALAAASKPLTYEEIAKAVKATAKLELVEWQGRLLLRYLQRADPPLLVRERKRYRALAAERLNAAAERYWRATPRT